MCSSTNPRNHFCYSVGSTSELSCTSKAQFYCFNGRFYSFSQDPQTARVGGAPALWGRNTSEPELEAFLRKLTCSL